MERLAIAGLASVPFGALDVAFFDVDGCGGCGVVNLLGGSALPVLGSRPSSPSVNVPADACLDPPPNRPAALDPGRLGADIRLVSLGGLSRSAAAAARIPAGLSAGASSPGRAPPGGDARLGRLPPRFVRLPPCRRASDASAVAASCMPALVRCSCMSCRSSACGYWTRVAAAMACRSRRRSGAVAASLAAAAVLPFAAPPAVSAMSSTAAEWNSAPASTAVEAPACNALTSLPTRPGPFQIATRGFGRVRGVLSRGVRRRRRAAAGPVRIAHDLRERLATCKVCSVCAMAGSRASERSARQHRARAASLLGGGSCFAPRRSIDRSARIPPDSLRAARAGRRRASTCAPNLSASLRSGLFFLTPLAGVAGCGADPAVAADATAPMFGGGATRLHTTWSASMTASESCAPAARAAMSISTCMAGTWEGSLNTAAAVAVLAPG